MGCKECEKSILERYKSISEATGRAFVVYKDLDNNTIYLDVETFNDMISNGFVVEEFETV